MSPFNAPLSGTLSEAQGVLPLHYTHRPGALPSPHRRIKEGEEGREIGLSRWLGVIHCS